MRLIAVMRSVQTAIARYSASALPRCQVARVERPFRAAKNAAPRDRLARLACQLALLLAGTGSALASAASTAPLRIVTSQLPPLAIEHSDARPGALTEMVEELARRVK